MCLQVGCVYVHVHVYTCVLVRVRVSVRVHVCACMRACVCAFFMSSCLCVFACACMCGKKVSLISTRMLCWHAHTLAHTLILTRAHAHTHAHADTRTVIQNSFPSLYTDRSLVEIAQHCPALSILNLGMCTRVRDAGVIVCTLSLFFQSKQLHALTHHSHKVWPCAPCARCWRHCIHFLSLFFQSKQLHALTHTLATRINN